MEIKILQGDCRETLKSLPDNSVHCCVTSPPYWGLRDYGVGVENGELGLEKTPEEYVNNLVEVFRKVKRVLRDDGTLWLNLGDSYWGGKGQNGTSKALGNADERGYKQPRGTIVSKMRPQDGKHSVIKSKDLIGIPWRVALALQADGWYLRQDIIWSKPNPMPESVTDRCTKSHEYIFLLTKSPKCYCDMEAIKEPVAEETVKRVQRGVSDKHKNINGAPGQTPHSMNKSQSHDTDRDCASFRNKRSVWIVTTKPYKGAHFATFPFDLIEPCILAGTSEKGCCSVCGTPLKRIVEKTRLARHELSEDDPRYRPNRYSGKHEEIRGNMGEDAGYTETETMGWEVGCKCKNAEIVPCTVLDPFSGAGTTGIVAKKHGRNYIGCELNPEYIELTNKRFDEKPKDIKKKREKKVVEEKIEERNEERYIQMDLFD